MVWLHHHPRRRLRCPFSCSSRESWDFFFVSQCDRYKSEIFFILIKEKLSNVLLGFGRLGNVSFRDANSELGRTVDGFGNFLDEGGEEGQARHDNPLGHGEIAAVKDALDLRGENMVKRRRKKGPVVLTPGVLATKMTSEAEPKTAYCINELPQTPMVKTD